MLGLNQSPSTEFPSLLLYHIILVVVRLGLLVIEFAYLSFQVDLIGKTL